MPQFEGSGSRTTGSKPIPAKSKVSGHPTQRRKPAPKKATAKKSYSTSAVRRRSTSRGGGGPAPRIRTTSSGRYSSPRAPSPGSAGPISPIVPTLSRYLQSDSAYQQEQSQFGKTLNDFLADIGRRRSQMTTEYGLGKKELTDQRLKDLKDIEADFASRGLIKSGLYGNRVGEYEGEYGQRLSDLERRQKNSFTDLSTEETNFKREQNLQREASKQSAVRRRAQKYGI